MVAADKLMLVVAIFAISAVSKFCRLFNFTRSQMLENFNSTEWILQNKDAYNSNIARLEGDPATALAYFHVIDTLPADLAHDVFEGIAITIMSQIIEHFVTHKTFNLRSLNKI